MLFKYKNIRVSNLRKGNRIIYILIQLVIVILQMKSGLIINKKIYFFFSLKSFYILKTELIIEPQQINETDRYYGIKRNTGHIRVPPNYVSNTCST